ncbi:MAG: hypothetical protein IK052_01535, partial [Bacteroidales bacterium]|nr:hypothetical protein [Bacteroidales bacterium]
MKSCFKLLTIAVMGALMALSCGKPATTNTETAAEKPVLTADMFSVTANAETGDVVFKFTANGLSPYWTVVDPAGNKTNFTDREVTKNYTVRGNYTGNVIAYGTSGQSDPADFSFTIGTTDPTLSATENLLISQTWKIRYYGWAGVDPDDGPWDYHEKVPAQAANIRMTFKKGGAFELNLGGSTSTYNDDVDGGWQAAVTVTGNEKWSYVKEGDDEFVQFSDGGFPGMLGGNEAVNARHRISDIDAESFSLCYQQTDAQWFYVTLVPDYFEEPAVEAPTAAAATAALSGKTFEVSDLGWSGTPDEYWEYFCIEEEGEIPAIMTNDTITFGADGSLTITLGIDEPKAEGDEPAARIYNDGVSGGEVYVVEGSPKWSILEEGGAVYVQFADGGFPLAIAGENDDTTNPNYHWGLNGKWGVVSIIDGTVRLNIFESWHGQYMDVCLSPV